MEQVMEQAVINAIIHLGLWISLGLLGGWMAAEILLRTFIRVSDWWLDREERREGLQDNDDNECI